MANEQVTTKPWYKSKIVVFSSVLLAVTGSNLLIGWASTQGVTIDQVNAVENAYPQAITIIDRIKSGEGIMSMIGSIAAIAIGVSRVWFTDSILPQSLKK